MRKLLVATAMVLTMALGLWFAIGASASSPNKPTRAPVKAQVAPAIVSGSHLHAGTALTVARKVATSRSSVSASSSSESENASENESEGGGDNENDTHEDPNGQDINHECPPNCDTVNGEQP